MGASIVGSATRNAFELYALDVPILGLARESTREQLEAAISPHTVAAPRLTGRFSRTARREI